VLYFLFHKHISGWSVRLTADSNWPGCATFNFYIGTYAGLSPASTSCLPSSPKKIKSGCYKMVTFSGVSVYYFSRRQSFVTVPSQGGSTLGGYRFQFFYLCFFLFLFWSNLIRLVAQVMALCFQVIVVVDSNVCEAYWHCNHVYSDTFGQWYVRVSCDCWSHFAFTKGRLSLVD